MKTVNENGQLAVVAKRQLAKLGTDQKNNILAVCAKALRDNAEFIVGENAKDMENAKNNNMPQGLQDRLMLNVERVNAMAEGLELIEKLPDPIGEVLDMRTLPNGLTVGQKRVPMGVIGIIYEARPNVTSDAFGLCLKAGSAVILRGGSDAIHSNIATVSVFRKATVMMRNAARLCAEKGTPCFVSMEKKMACGIGACLGCTCETKSGEGKSVCKNGPVFDATEVFF